MLHYLQSSDCFRRIPPGFRVSRHVQKNVWVPIFDNVLQVHAIWILREPRWFFRVLFATKVVRHYLRNSDGSRRIPPGFRVSRHVQKNVWCPIWPNTAQFCRILNFQSKDFWLGDTNRNICFEKHRFWCSDRIGDRSNAFKTDRIWWFEVMVATRLLHSEISVHPE